jgi:hypothetical protein
VLVILSLAARLGTWRSRTDIQTDVAVCGRRRDSRARLPQTGFSIHFRYVLPMFPSPSSDQRVANAVREHGRRWRTASLAALALSMAQSAGLAA